MSHGDELQRQIADIGVRYLKRTLGELADLRAAFEDARRGSSEALRELSRMAHKIQGSGATFGFDAISGRAYEVEQLASSPTPAMEQLDASLTALEHEVRSQAQQRGVQ